METCKFVNGKSNCLCTHNDLWVGAAEDVCDMLISILCPIIM